MSPYQPTYAPMPLRIGPVMQSSVPAYLIRPLCHMADCVLSGADAGGTSAFGCDVDTPPRSALTCTGAAAR